MVAGAFDSPPVRCWARLARPERQNMDTRMLSMGMDVAPESSDAEALTVRYGAIEPLPESWEGEAMAALDKFLNNPAMRFARRHRT